MPPGAPPSTSAGSASSSSPCSSEADPRRYVGSSYGRTLDRARRHGRVLRERGAASPAELRGKPVVVATGTDPGARGVVMAASYEARRFGVHSAVPLAVAHRRCPQAVLIARDMAYYRELSRKVMGMLARYSDLVEVLGSTRRTSTSPISRAARAAGGGSSTRSRGAGPACSVGLAPDKLLAKIASGSGQARRLLGPARRGAPVRRRRQARLADSRRRPQDRRTASPARHRDRRGPRPRRAWGAERRRRPARPVASRACQRR